MGLVICGVTGWRGESGGEESGGGERGGEERGRGERRVGVLI